MKVLKPRRGSKLRLMKVTTGVERSSVGPSLILSLASGRGRMRSVSIPSWMVRIAGWKQGGNWEAWKRVGATMAWAQA